MKNTTSTLSKKAELVSPNGDLKATFSSTEGGRLTSLIYKDKPVIQDLEHTAYTDSFASSVLFPFANRINKGTYEFDGKEYQLEQNEIDRENAIHGLVYDKAFQLKNIEETETEHSLEFYYEMNNPPVGFPFPFAISLIYKMSNSSLDLLVKVENKSEKAFPFTLGWHPYFVADNLNDCVLEFDSLKQILFNQDLITIGISNSFAPVPFSLNQPYLDHCFVLHNHKLSFKTPNYHVMIENTDHSRYLQLYKPANENRIAIEPMTGISDSFNNKKDLKVLQAYNIFVEEWKINFIN